MFYLVYHIYIYIYIYNREDITSRYNSEEVKEQLDRKKNKIPSS